MTEHKFFEGKNVYAYQKHKNAPQALLPFLEQMSEAMSSSKYGIVVANAGLRGAFDAVGRDTAICKLYEAGIRNNMLSLFDSLCFSLVNTYSSNWVQTHTGVPQGSLLSPFTFLVYTSDLTMEEETPDSNHAKNDQQNQDPRESKYADNVEFWRVYSNIYQLLIDIQIAIINLQEWCSEWSISINSIKTNYTVFYDKSNNAFLVQIPIIIDGNCLRKVSSQRVLGIIIDGELSFTSHVENITKKKAKKHITD